MKPVAPDAAHLDLRGQGIARSHLGVCRMKGGVECGGLGQAGGKARERLDGGECISNKGMAGAALALMILFSIFVQAAEGLHYGVVPYVSRPALGVVSGMVSAGGNLGAVILLASFFEGGNLRLDEGLLRLGMVVCGLTTLIVFIYFPEHGSMLLRARALGTRYDPQLIKPPAGYLGR